jgi:hypothetical protein
MANRKIEYENGHIKATITIEDSGSVKSKVEYIADISCQGKAIDLSKVELDELGLEIKNMIDTFTSQLICLTGNVAQAVEFNLTDNIHQTGVA